MTGRSTMRHSNATIAAVRLYRRGSLPAYSSPAVPVAAVDECIDYVAMAVGVPSANILLDEQSLRTRDNAVRSAALLRAEGIGTVLLVTSPLHLLRAKLAFEALGISAYPVRASKEI